MRSEQDSRCKALERSPERVRARKRANTAIHRPANIEKHANASKNSFDAIKAAEKHYCEPCDYSAGAPSALASHNLSASHLAKVAAHHLSSKLD